MSPEGYAQNQLPYIILTILEITTGMWMNLFVIYTVVGDFIKTRTLSSSYKILLCLAISNVCFGFLMLVGLLDSLYILGVFSMNYTTYIYLYLLVFSINLSSWLSASLGFFYFIKISNYDSGIFSWFTRNMSSSVPWILLLNLVSTLFNSFLSSYVFISSPLVSRNITDNMSLISLFSLSSTGYINSMISNSIGPFLVLFLTTFFSVVSLRKHRQRMKKDVQVPTSRRRDSYDKVVCYMTSSLLTYGFYYLVIVICYFTVVTTMESSFSLLLLILSLFPTLQSILLVLANPRLRAAWVDMFSWVRLRDSE